jgi:hypothetical protein
MSDQTRELPEQPNLRFLKLEAKRRLAAGEFATRQAPPVTGPGVSRVAGAFAGRPG